jgi:hypothetical protein
MPKVNIEYDTESKKLTCSCDGVTQDAEYVGFYKNGDDAHSMEIGLKSEKKSGMMKYTKLYASEQEASPTWFSKILNRN